jgi:hypothetical protein
MLSSMYLVSLAALAPAPAATLPDPCALFTREEVEKLAGEPTRKPHKSETSQINSISCRTSSSTGQWSVALVIEDKGSQEMLGMYMKSIKNVAGGLKEVKGLGDEAYWGQINPNNGQFHVIIGTVVITVQTWGKAAGAGTMEKTRPIADLVISRYKAAIKG